jgi:hypothetical protein
VRGRNLWRGVLLKKKERAMSDPFIAAGTQRLFRRIISFQQLKIIETPALFSPAIFCLIFLSMDLDDRFLYKLCAFEITNPAMQLHLFVLTFKLDPHSIIIFHVFYSPDIYFSLQL